MRMSKMLLWKTLNARNYQVIYWRGQTECVIKISSYLYLSCYFKINPKDSRLNVSFNIFIYTQFSCIFSFVIHASIYRNKFITAKEISCNVMREMLSTWILDKCAYTFYIIDIIIHQCLFHVHLIFYMIYNYFLISI